MRFTEKFLLPFTGPAEVGDPRKGRPSTAEELARAEQVHRGMRRVRGSDGRDYFVKDDGAER